MGACISGKGHQQPCTTAPATFVATLNRSGIICSAASYRVLVMAVKRNRVGALLPASNDTFLHPLTPSHVSRLSPLSR
ncbi:uncharacterized protein BKA78DRAFT_315750 [Phyllosticta capitalensis]|uniref:uncharacterized protein n=1 Tax=Phyllosticta capitalensis TaxID=121624 RepID=UPI00312DE9C7